MGYIQDLLAWSETTLLPLGPWGLFITSFLESSFFPIPPDLLLIPLVLLRPDLWWFYALIATVGSVLGSILGYAIGLKGGRPVLFKLAGKKRTKSVERYYRRYGDWAVAVAGFTPIPYKVFTIASGVFRYSIYRMLVISLFARGARFALFAGVVALFGQEIIVFVETYFGPATLLMIGIAFLIYLLYLKYSGRELLAPHRRKTSR